MSKVVTGRVRLCYPALAAPKPNMNGEPKYSLHVLVPKSDTKTVDKLRQAMLTAAQDKWGQETKMGALKTTLRDGDAEVEAKGPDYEGYMFFNVSSSFLIRA